MRKTAVLFAIVLFSAIILADLGPLRQVLRLVNRVPYLDKVLHFFLIGTLMYLVAASLIEALPAYNPVVITLTTAVILALVFSIEEYSQGPIRGRTASWTDLAANYAGIIVFGTFSWYRFRNRKLGI